MVAPINYSNLFFILLAIEICSFYHASYGHSNKFKKFVNTYSISQRQQRHLSLQIYVNFNLQRFGKSFIYTTWNFFRVIDSVEGSRRDIW